MGCLGLGLGDCPKHPSQKTSAVGGPDNDCLFHPELPKCKADNGKCPHGFFQNENYNCFPKHDNALRVISHENDETGRCIPKSYRKCEGKMVNKLGPIARTFII